MTAPEVATPATRTAPRSPRRAAWAALRAFVARDLTVLDNNLHRFVPSATVQPLLLVFVFTYLFPTVGQTIGGEAGGERFSTTLLPGIVAQSILFVGIFTVGMNLVLELDADELEDRVLAPVPIATAAFGKIAGGALQAMVAALIVFPIAAFLPAGDLYLRADWALLLTVMPLACVTAAALGLTLGVLFEPRSGHGCSASSLCRSASLGPSFTPGTRSSPCRSSKAWRCSTRSST